MIHNHKIEKEECLPLSLNIYAAILNDKQVERQGFYPNEKMLNAISSIQSLLLKMHHLIIN